jgi:DNA repair protein RecO (recombination protein O)
MAVRRISSEPGFVLHHYDWSESSLILDVFTRQFGRLTVVAKGAKRPSSNFRSVLLPLQKLALSLSGREEVLTLRSAEWVGGYPMPSGRALMAGLYLNELLMRLVPREDESSALFDAYDKCVMTIATQGDEMVECALRAFEFLLLRQCGVLPALGLETINQSPVVADQFYALQAEVGLTRASPGDATALQGDLCLRLAQWLEGQYLVDFAGLMHTCAGAMTPLKLQLRPLLLQHAGVDQFRTRAMARQLAAV